MKKYYFSGWLLILLMLPGCEQKKLDAGETYDSYLILVSMDGFRWDYPDLYPTPNFDVMAMEGVKAERLIPSFPTKTFPNHYTIATGLYPDHHGLIGNTFFAPDLDMLYKIGNPDVVRNPDFYGGEPIWITSEMQGTRSASFFWVGSEAPIAGIYPSIWKQYDESIEFGARVDTIISWLKLPLEERPRLIMLYFHEPDEIGHTYGPHHEQTKQVIQKLDNILGDMRKELSKLPYGDKINLIVTSDHGMGSISSDRYVNIMDHVDPARPKDIYGSNPVYFLETGKDLADTTAFLLNAVDGVTAWKKENIPARMNFGSNERIPDVVVVADSAWSIGVKEGASGYIGGTHGYDNANTDMHAIFYADGPDFKDNYDHGSFENVHIYALIAHILNLEPAETDGDIDEVIGMLK